MSDLAQSQLKIFHEAIATQSILFLFYVATIIRQHLSAKLDFVLYLALLLASTCLTWIFECWLKYLYLATVGEDTPCYLTKGQQGHGYCLWFSIFQMLNVVCYNTAIWMFAIRYWALSQILYQTINNEVTIQFQLTLNVITYIGLFVNFAISMCFSWLMYYGKSTQTIFVIEPLLWLLSFAFLIDALRRIRLVMKKLTDVVLISEAFFLYAATAALAIIGQIPVIVLGFINNQGSRYSNALAAITIINNVVIFLFQVCLIIIFNNLISANNKSRASGSSLQFSRKSGQISECEKSIQDDDDFLSELPSNTTALIKSSGQSELGESDNVPSTYDLGLYLHN